MLIDYTVVSSQHGASEYQNCPHKFTHYLIGSVASHVLAFVVFPQAPTFLQPSEGTLHHPPLWNDGKRVPMAVLLISTG